MKKCVFAGSFDPVTIGHMHVIERCAMMFEKVVVAIGVNAEKKYYFSKEKRLEMLKLCCARFKNVEVCCFDNMLGDFMAEIEAEVLVRGVRDQKDIDYEEKSFKVTSAINPNVDLMFFQAPPKLKNVSSTFVKELIRQKKSFKKYLPEEIWGLFEK